MANHSKLTSLGELFEQATREGIDEWELADRLLGEVKAGLTAYGYRRQFTFGDDGARIERLPRDTHRQPMPRHLWNELRNVSAGLDSEWIDNPDDPEQWATMDWIGGQFETIDVDMGAFDTIRLQFLGIAIPTNRAKALIAALVGKPKKQRGAPKGTRNKWEREQAHKGFELVCAGDERTIPQIAASLVHRDAVGVELDNQKRRIGDGIKRLLAAAKKSEPE